jgi:hypothetical protein
VAPPAGFFGVNGVVLRAWSSQGRHELVERHLEAIEQTGIEFVRAHLGWQRLEPAPPQGGRHAYDFGDADAWVAALARHGLRWYVLGVGIPTPRWAAIDGLPPGCAPRSPPARPGDFAAAMAAIAKRYGHRGTFWDEHPELPRVPVVDYEVWNAPNHGGDWCPQPDPRAYAELYSATRAAIHAADPEARAVIGGLGAFRETGSGEFGAQEIEPGEFLESMLSASPTLRAGIDAVGVHIYAADAKAALGELAWLRERLEKIGLEKVPISWNEVGWPTRGEGGAPPVPEALRAGYLLEVGSADLNGCAVASLAPHTWVSEQRDPADPEHWFGIADPASAAPYPSAVAYRNAIERARDRDTAEAPCG